MKNQTKSTHIHQEVLAFLKEDWKLFNQHFEVAFKTEYKLLNTVLQYILKSKGKKIRPILVLLSAKMFGNTNLSVFRAATLIEMLHTATLIHDDVVDGSQQRRNLLTINVAWKNKIAVLSGDYLLAKGMLIALENKEYEILEILSKAVKEMSEGELLQVEKNKKLNTDENIYFEIIRKKTASLFAACCACGCASNCKDISVIQTMENIGTEMGMIFQMQDDLLDLSKSQSGKPMYTDIKEKKMTLSLIHTYKNITSRKQRIIKKLLNKKKINPLDIETLLALVHEAGGIDYVRTQIEKRKKNLEKLMSDLPQNQASYLLKHLVLFLADRNY